VPTHILPITLQAFRAGSKYFAGLSHLELETLIYIEIANIHNHE